MITLRLLKYCSLTAEASAMPKGAISYRGPRLLRSQHTSRLRLSRRPLLLFFSHGPLTVRTDTAKDDVMTREDIAMLILNLILEVIRIGQIHVGDPAAAYAFHVVVRVKLALKAICRPRYPDPADETVLGQPVEISVDGGTADTGINPLNHGKNLFGSGVALHAADHLQDYETLNGIACLHRHLTKHSVQAIKAKSLPYRKSVAKHTQ